MDVCKNVCNEMKTISEMEGKAFVWYLNFSAGFMKNILYLVDWKMSFFVKFGT